jgi:hypothetical protein
MAHKGGRKIDNHGMGGEFLKEESRRGKLPSGSEVMPKPHFVQPDNGSQTGRPGGLHASYDPTKARVKSGNVETDLTGGLY